MRPSHSTMAAVLGAVGLGAMLPRGGQAVIAPERDQPETPKPKKSAPPRRVRTGRARYTFRHVQGNPELERQLAEHRAKEAKSSPYAAAAIDQAAAKRERKRLAERS